jgi:hypothetical protein
MNMPFLAASPDLYSYFTNKTYPSSNFPFPKEVDDVPDFSDFSTCISDNERKSLKATHFCNHKTRGDIVTMNVALSDIFLSNLPKAICETYKSIHMKQLSTVFLHMFNWFITKYGYITTKDSEEFGREWPTPGVPPKVLSPLQCTSSSALPTPYASAARYPMDDRDIIDIRPRIIKCCGMYAKDFKHWILRKNVVPLIFKTINSFKEYWANVISLVNHTAVPALQHGYGITAMDNELLGDSLANFSAKFAAMQETMKSQANSLVAMQNQLSNIQLYMNVGH